MEFHEVADLFPHMAEEDYQRLKNDIAENGLLEPILVHENRIVDGRHRYRACLELGIAPKVQEWNGEGSLVQCVLSLNLHRRHLTASQRAMVGAELRPLFEQAARERAKAGVSAILHGGPPGKTSEQAARLVNVSMRSVDTASSVKSRGLAELQDAVKEGAVNVSLAAEIAGLPADEQRRILSLDNKKSMRQALRRGRGQEDTAPAAKQTTELTRRLMPLLDDIATLLDHGQPAAIAQRLVASLPVDQPQLTAELDRKVQQASELFQEIVRLRAQVSNQ